MQTNHSFRLIACQARLLAALFLHASPLYAAQPSALPGSAAQCIAPYQFIELRAQDTGISTDAYGSSSAILGMYERISPDGRLVLRSFSGRQLGDVALMELPAPGQAAHIVRSYATPLKNEAFPVQGSWRYLVNPNGAHYRLQDILQHGKRAKAVFKGGMTGFYAAAAELPANPAQPAGQQVQIRSLSWPTGDGLYGQGVGALMVRTITVDVAQQRVLADTGRQRLCHEAERRPADGTLYALPMIAPDGLSFSAMPQNPSVGGPSMRIFGFGEYGNGCQLHTDLQQISGKVTLGYAQAQEAADAVFESAGTVWWHSRQLQRSFPLRPPEHLLPNLGRGQGEWLPSGFPALTRDGRVLYGVSFEQCQTRPCLRRVGYLIADPYQLPDVAAQNQGQLPRCIETAAVFAERARFAKQHGLTTP